MPSQDTMIITEASVPRSDGGGPIVLVSDDGNVFWELTSLLRWAGGSDLEAISVVRPVLVDRGATFTERPVRHCRASHPAEPRNPVRTGCCPDRDRDGGH
jgi:hypothetical protein